MGLSCFYFWLQFFIWHCSFWIALLSNWRSKSLLAEGEKRETSLEKSRKISRKMLKKRHNEVKQRALTARTMCSSEDWGGENSGGVLWGRGSTSTDRALHTISISLQISFSESHTWRLVSWKALRALNAHWALTLDLVFEDEKSNGWDEKSVKRKIA